MALANNHSSMRAARLYIETHPRIIELIGDVEGFGWFPQGGFHVSGGHGEANYTFRVNGARGTVHVYVRLIREPLREWEVVYFRYRQ